MPLLTQENDSGDAAEQDEGESGKAGEPGCGCEYHHEAARDRDREAVAQELPRELMPGVAVFASIVASDACHDEARRDADEEGGDLRNEPVADGQDRVAIDDGREVLSFLGHPDDQSADDVDGRDDDAGDGVALHELHGAVHRAVELRLLLQRLAASSRFDLVDEPTLEVVVDAHLLAGHTVEREARRDLGDPSRALRDHDELDEHQDEKDDAADDHVVVDDQAAKDLDHPARVPITEDHLRRGDVEGEPQQRREQENGRHRR